MRTRRLWRGTSEDSVSGADAWYLAAPSTPGANRLTFVGPNDSQLSVATASIEKDERRGLSPKEAFPLFC
jgi:hypothetical protein